MPPRPPLTHFLCLPLVTPSSRSQILASLHHFATDVANPESEDLAVIPAKAIRPIGTLHLTLEVMSLQSPEKVDAASNFLRSLDVRELLHEAAKVGRADHTTLPEAAGGTATSSGMSVDTTAKSLEIVHPLTITLSGLHPMHTPTSTSILYASPLDDTCRLYPFSLALQQAFTSADFLLQEDRGLRLHATIVNTIYAKDKKARVKEGGHRNTSKGSRKFNAQGMITKYEGFEWAKDVHIERLSICEMGAKEIIEDEQVMDEKYLEIASVPLP